jgi:hypothetical protein
MDVSSLGNSSSPVTFRVHPPNYRGTEPEWSPLGSQCPKGKYHSPFSTAQTDWVIYKQAQNVILVTVLEAGKFKSMVVAIWRGSSCCVTAWQKNKRAHGMKGSGLNSSF